jgi:hypothetical protein
MPHDRVIRVLAGVLRAGNAGSHTVIDHHDVLTLLLEQLPVAPTQAPTLVRVDSAGASHGFVDALRDAARSVPGLSRWRPTGVWSAPAAPSS